MYPYLGLINLESLSYRNLSKIERLGEHGSDPRFPRARASEYSTERGQSYLLSSEWVQELPCRYGRQTLPINGIGEKQDKKSCIDVLHIGFRLDLVW